MKPLIYFIILISGFAYPQAAGNAIYGTSTKKEGVNKYFVASLNDSQFVITSNLMYCKKADYLKLTFAVSSFAENLEQATIISDGVINNVSENFNALDLRLEHFVDYIGHNRVYGIEKEGNDYREILKGFELKRNIIVIVKNHEEMNKVIQAAANAGVYDVAAVEYIVENIPAVEEFMIEKASKILEKKAAKILSLNNLTGYKQQRLYDLEFKSYSPSDLYSRYQAAVSSSVNISSRSNSNLIEAEPITTYYLQSLNHSGFDEIIEEEKLEPAVRFALSLKVVYSKK